MFSRFIVATDLSPASFAMLHCLSCLKNYGASHCLLLQCLSPDEVDSGVFDLDINVLNGILQQQKGIVEKQGFSVETRIVSGDTKHELNQIAIDEKYDLFVVGSREYSLLGETFLGGVANDVMHHACKPVLLLRIDFKSGCKEQMPSHFKFNEHVLYPTDFSDNSNHAFHYLEKLVANGAKRVTLLHVRKKLPLDQKQSFRSGEGHDADQFRLLKMKELLQQCGKADITTEVCAGSPIKEILRIIQEREVHLVVMATQSRGLLGELFLGSVSHDVARHSEAGVLFIPPQQSDPKLLQQ